LLQTEKNLSSKPENQVFSQEKDRYVFQDLVKAIDYASKQSEVTVEVFQGNNAQMDSKLDGQPVHPGVLRENVPINVGDYVPTETVTKDMVQAELDEIETHSIKDSWEMYARLAKLQAFDNGNKRTSLIAANINSGAFHDGDDKALTIPTDYRRAQFDANLINYYMADDWDDHFPDVGPSLEDFVKFASDYTEGGK
jgi:hypothetical protein